MKKILLAFAAALLLVGCAKEYDDSTLKARIDGLEKRVSDLEGSITAIQTAVGDGVLVAKVQELADPETGKIVGVTITYTNGDIKYFEITPKADYDGPVLSVIKSGSGDLVWAIDGVAIEVNGKEVPVYQTPEFTIDEDGNLLVSIDGGEPVVLGQVQNEGATLVDGIFTDIKITDEAVVLTLSDGSTVNIPFAEAFKLTLEVEEYAYTAGAPITVHYDVTAATAGTVVKVAGYNPLEFGVKIDADAKTIEITPIKKGAAAQMLVVADSGIGMVSTATLLIEPEGVTVVNSEADSLFGMADYVADGAGDVIEAIVVSNVNFQVLPQEEWIHLESVKGQTYTITLSLDPNEDTESGRLGTVLIVKEGIPADAVTESDIYQTITIAQMQAPIPEEPDGIADLSEKESANSYIVLGAGAFKFKAVKGNTEESVGEVANVEVLWETVNTDTAPAAGDIIGSYGYSDGYILFDATGTPGNALIAAKDASDNILWSWHIWVPETPIENSTFGGLYGEALIMDRNLGALVATAADGTPDVKSYGMYYQWGRKDPFVAPSTGIAGTMTYDAAKMNVADAIQNPTAYVKTGGDSVKDWSNESPTDLWGVEKTIYDPCPPGYIVPTRDKSTKWWGEKLALNLSFAGDNSWFKAGVDYDEANPAATGYAVFPVCGYIDQGDLVKMGSRVYIWSAYSSSADLAYQVRGEGGSVYVEEQRKSRAGNVRCVVANEDAIVPPTPAEPVAETIDLSEEGTANSYIVYAEGEYKFAAVKGNSEESVGDVASVEVLWETVNTETAPEAASIVNSCGISEGYIIFGATGTPGNALIAAKDASDNILWSWHIWVPETPIENSTFGGLYGEALIMDRNLGALVATAADGTPDVKSYGMYYQWGRKDPFVAPSTGIAGTMTYDAAKMNVADAIQNPTAYVKTGGDSVKDWSNESPTDLWGVEKTIYDPCPPGYIVPTRDKSTKWWGEKLALNLSFAGDNSWFKAGVDYDEANPAATGYAVFPVCGYIDQGDLVKMGSRVYIWSAYSSSADLAYQVRGEGGSVYVEEQRKSRAGNVRCVAE